MSIRERYINVVREIAKRHGHEPYGYKVSRNATLPQCIGYTLKHVVNTRAHYRYGRYRQAVQTLLSRYGNYRRTRKIVHIDVGCGPGLFTWVVHDYFMEQEPRTELDLYGYDPATQMATLAGLIWDEIGTGTHLHVDCELDNIVSDIQTGFEPADVIVSFGHVLVQVADDIESPSNFAELLREVCLGRSSLVVAVDAKGRDGKFRAALVDLRVELELHRMKLQYSDSVLEKSEMYGIVTR